MFRVARGGVMVVMVALAACAAPKPKYMWTKDGTTEAEFNQAAARCEYEATASTQNTDPTLRSVFGQELDRAMRKENLAVLCMKAAGYRQVQLP